MKSIVIVEQVKTIREGIKILINRFSDYECTTAFEDFQLFKENLKSLNSDILLVDIDYKGIVIEEEIKELKINFPSLQIILLIMNDENEKIFEALASGAVGYIHKNAPSQKLLKLLKDVVENKFLINSLIARKTVKFITDKKLTQNYDENELKLLQKMTEGNSLFAIEKSLKMSVEDIKLNFRRILNKLFEYNKRDLIKA
jgi:DNA-binding NarL/FixJ family response regulator